MNLLEVQRRMAQAIFQPLTGADRMRPGSNVAFIKPNSRLSSLERLEIYSRSYWFRILDSLYDDFPGLRAVLGQRAFHRLSRAYLAHCPSQSFTLRNLGSRLSDWIQQNPDYTGPRWQLALDMARLEWAHIEAFDNAAETVLGPEDLLELTPALRLGLQPYLRLLALNYPVDNLRIHVNQVSEEQGTTSNTAIKHKHRALLQRSGRLKPERLFLAVHRMDFTVYYRRVVEEEFLLLTALREGRPIGKAIRHAFHTSTASPEQQASMLNSWFATWAELGWLCRPATKRGKRTA